VIGDKTDIRTPMLLQLRDTPMVETGGGVTPSHMETPCRTPYRNQLNINIKKCKTKLNYSKKRIN